MRTKKIEFYRKTIFLLIAIFLIIIILFKLSKDIIKNEIVNFLKSPISNEFLIEIINSKIDYLSDRNFTETEREFYKKNIFKIKEKFEFLFND